MNLVQSQSLSHFDGETRCASCQHKSSQHCTDEGCCDFDFVNTVGGACLVKNCACYECVRISAFLSFQNEFRKSAAW